MKLKIILILLLSLNLFSQEFPKREFRAAWIATVANIDWPTSKQATTEEKISELIFIFDKLKEAGLNSVLFQVRTECDALYKSSIEPWSYWLTGEQGKEPEPFFDPLEFAINEAHKRNMELHAWFNPYRAEKNKGDYITHESHITNTHPEWILTFDKYSMLNPGIPAVTEYVTEVIADVLERYDLDGIHFDDYFYPYSPIKDEDYAAFEQYGYGFNDIHEWRRDNINNMVSKVYETIKTIKPNVKFGISPFGIVENKYAGTNGFESYKILYCDPLTWIKNASIDYLTPQLYWEMGHEKADYKKLLPWWAEVSENVQLYIGLYSSRMMAADYSGSLAEIGNQIRMNRKTANVTGSVFFSAKSIYKNYSGLLDSLKEIYKYPALIPVMSWKDFNPPAPPENLTIIFNEDKLNLKWDLPIRQEEISYFVIYKFNSNEVIDLDNPQKIIGIVDGRTNTFQDNFIRNEEEKFFYIVTSVDRMHNESINNSKVYYKIIND
jgi:uncharacterized lipoprotein YddW (UPF0748 family)